MTHAAEFFNLFKGNPEAHYVRSLEGAYEAVYNGLTVADFERHLAGISPSILVIPISREGMSHVGIIDWDRHDEHDGPVDHAALAAKITRLQLPLIAFKSKNGKGAWIVLFLKEKEGCKATLVRQLLMRYQQLLELDGEVEIFPKQDKLEVVNDKWQMGNGVNVGYFGCQRPAYGKDGVELTAEQFIALAQERRSFGEILAKRDLVATVAEAAPQSNTERALPIDVIRELHAKNLGNLRAMTRQDDNQNDALNTCAFFAARAFAAKALEGTEESIKEELRVVAESTKYCPGIDSTITSGWSSGIDRPLLIFNPEQAHAEALAKIDAWLGDKDGKLESEDALSNLALLTDEEYESGDRRGNAAKRLGIKKPAKLDKFVDDRRRYKVKDQTDTSNIIVEEVKPWHESVNGAALLDELAATARRFVIFQRQSEADAIALWLVSTYCCEKFNILPYLGVTAPAPECGKTTVMKILLYLCLHPVQSSNVSGAVVYRVIELYSPTLLVDEVDSFLNSERNSELVGIFNAGHEREFAHVLRCVGEDSTPTKFNCFGPKAFGMIGRPPDTLLSRSIVIRLLRKDAGEKTEDLNVIEHPELRETFTTLKQKIARWVRDNANAIALAKPDTSSLANRARDNWQPLLKIAGVAGKDWTEKALAAAGAPTLKRQENDIIRALRDARKIFKMLNTDRIPSRILVQYFLQQKLSGWNRFYNQRDDIDERGLARLLGEFDWHNKPLKMNETQMKLLVCNKQERCYVLDDRIDGLFAKFLEEEVDEVEIPADELEFQAAVSDTEIQ